MLAFENNAGDFLSIQSKMDFQTAISQPKGISGIRKENPELLNSILSTLITRLAVSLNVNNNLSEDQIEEMVVMIQDEFWMLRPEEIMYVFKKAKMGHYGRVEFSLDIVKIFSWINTYIEKERLPYFEEKNHSDGVQKTPEEIASISIAERRKLPQLLGELDLSKYQPKQLNQ